MKNTRSAFTLVELLVVIAIIGILMGLLIPAVNAAREAARRNECSTHLKNLSLAAIQHENTKGQLPGYVQSFGEFAGGADPTNPGSSAPAHLKLGTWAVALMPWLDAQPTYEHWTEDRYPVISAAGSGAEFHEKAAPNLAIMQCASNPSDDSDFGRNSYASNNGMHPYGSVTFDRSMDRTNGAFSNQFVGGGQPLGPKMRLDDFKDGQGNTILFSENIQALSWNRPGLVDASYLASGSVAYPPTSRYSQGLVWHYEDADYGDSNMGGAWNTLGVPEPVNSLHRINGGGTTVAQDKFNLKMNDTNAPHIARPSSAHVDVVNAGMADGGTRSFSQSIDYRVYQALLTPKGKSSSVPWPEYVYEDGNN